MILVVDPVLRFFCHFSNFLLFEMFLVLVCLIFEGVHFAVELYFYLLWY